MDLGLEWKKRVVEKLLREDGRKEEKKDMDLDPEWKEGVAGKLLQEEGQKEEKKYLLKLSSQNDQI